MKFQEELFKLEQSEKPLPNRASRFKPPSTVRCQYANREILIYNYANRKKNLIVSTMAFWLIILRLKKNVGIDTGIIPKISSYNM